MNIIDMIKEGLRIARTARSLWLYGFVVGLWAVVRPGSNNNYVPGVPGVPGAPVAAHVAPRALTGGTALLGVAVLVLIAAAIFMYFVSEGALIEGVRGVRRAQTPSVRQGWRDGLAHWGVLLRIALIYCGTLVGSFLVLAAPSVLALKLFGTALAVTLAIPAVIIAVPWLVTLYMWQAFATRIAVIENRHTGDAIAKARLFLHGRLLQGLKVIVAAILGRLIVVIVGAIGLAAVGLLIVGALKVLGVAPAGAPVIALGALTLLPIAFILVAISGTTQSSIWTIGYLTQAQQ